MGLGGAGAAHGQAWGPRAATRRLPRSPVGRGREFVKMRWTTSQRLLSAQAGADGAQPLAGGTAGVRQELTPLHIRKQLAHLCAEKAWCCLGLRGRGVPGVP